MTQPSIASWMRAASSSSSSPAASLGALSQTDDDIVDLTEERKSTQQPPTAPAAAAAASAAMPFPATPTLTPKQQMLAQLAGQSTPWRSANSHGSGGSSASGSGSSSARPTPPLHAGPLSKPRLQLSSVTHTAPPPPASSMASSYSAAAAPSIAAAATAAAAAQPPPMRLSELTLSGLAKREPGTSQQPAQQYEPARVTKRETAPPLAAAPFTLTPPPSHGSGSSSNHVRAPQSAPQMSRQPTPHAASVTAAPATAAASSSHSHTPAGGHPSGGSFSLRNVNGDVLEENEDEKLVRRRNEIDAQIMQLEEEMNGLQARVRELKGERRAVQERLDRPPPMPSYAQSGMQMAAAGGAPVGGASSLITGPAFWSGAFPWDSEALHVLQSVFGLSTWRVSQREVINATMSGKDCFCIMPTGAGKSLLYQLPAVLSGGLTLVISPLLSLMEDQLIHLRACGIESYMLCGTTTREDANSIYAHMVDRHSGMRLLFCTPEKISKSKQMLAKLERTYEMQKLKRIVIDEAHCCSQWGHDFRPDYRKLNVLKQQFPDVPILAVTATATEKVARDCQSILKMHGCQSFKCSFNRPNLHFSVHDKSGTTAAVAKDMYRFIESIGHLESSGIVYCYSKKETMEVCSQLSALGIPCDFYNSDVTPEHRQRVHHRWVRNEIRVVVATNAFGLGINKPDVRFVLHHTIPQGVESYYQEAGRAGRDGVKSYCALWYSPRDLTRQMTQHLYPLISYAHQIDQCRRVLMSRYFGEKMHASQCGGMCDVCELTNSAAIDAEAAAAAGVDPPPPPFVVHDLSEASIQLCEYVMLHEADKPSSGGGKGKRRRASATGPSVTQKQLVDAIRSKSSPVSLPKSFSRDDCERLIIELMLQGVLKETFRNTAYSTNSYLQVDTGLMQQLKRGNMIMRIKFVDHARAKKQAAAAAAGGSGSGTKRRASTSKKKKAEAPSAQSQIAPADEEVSDLDGDDNDEYVDDAQYEIELEDEEAFRQQQQGEDDIDDDDDEAEYAAAAPMRRTASAASSARAARAPVAAARAASPTDDFSLDDASSEDMPLKKTRRASSVQSRTLASAQQPRRAAAAAVSARTSHADAHDDEWDHTHEQHDEQMQRALRESLIDF